VPIYPTYYHISLAGNDFQLLYGTVQRPASFPPYLISCDPGRSAPRIGPLRLSRRDGEPSRVWGENVFPSISRFELGTFIAMAYCLMIPLRLNRRNILSTSRRSISPVLMGQRSSINRDAISLGFVTYIVKWLAPSLSDESYSQMCFRTSST
jgi:hypothetical protein